MRLVLVIRNDGGYVNCNGKSIRPGDEVKRGDIPDDAFDFLASRGDFAVVDEFIGEEGDNGPQY